VRPARTVSLPRSKRFVHDLFLSATGNRETVWACRKDEIDHHRGGRLTSTADSMTAGPRDGTALILSRTFKDPSGPQPCPIEGILLQGGLDTCMSDDLKGGRIGALLIDEACQSWEITGATKVGVDGGAWARFWAAIIPALASYKVRYDLVPKGALSLDEVKDRVCAAIDADPSWWVNEELAAGEDGPPVSEEAQLDKFKAAVRRAGTLHDLSVIIEDVGDLDE
jgi:hypothetical protein